MLIEHNYYIAIIIYYIACKLVLNGIYYLFIIY